ncbi:DNA (cytosine-5)-methyltransferase 1 [Bacillus sp. YF23]|uniref:DNA cytosine methyltransferase n=1 Tax=Bacillus sp. YF23 TaxID=691698 RepID=UPI000BF61814|nr:DNA cytosine methyltransferase [Bacillus sp. YF23]PFG72726.1 DNA (cytosine-5)-methyltransferase 1 [Bacillus sp. YF23]
MAIAISFFAGAGGLDLGIHRAGFDVKLSVELETVYCETLKINNPNWNIKQGDIMEYNASRVREDANLGESEEIDLLFGGSPCQSFSTAGKRQAFNDPRGQAMLKFVDLIHELQPKAFLIENVKGLLSSPLKNRPLKEKGEGFPPLTEEETKGSALRFLLNRFEGYNIATPTLVNSADFGVPQARERVFIVGIREDLNRDFIFPTPTHNKNGNNGLLPWRTVGQVLENLKVEEHNYQEYSEDRLKYMQMIPLGGGNWRDLPEDVVKEAMGGAYTSGGGKVGFFRRVNVNKPSPTVLTSPTQKSTNLGHPYEDRALSIQEYLAIQEFPKDYIVKGTLGKQYTQIGNAVPVRLAEVMGRAILKTLKT